MQQEPLEGMPESFASVTRTIHTVLGGRAELRDVVALIKNEHPHLCIKTDADLLREARAALTEHDHGGKPFAASVDGEGQYVQRALFTADEYTVVVGRYVDQAASSLAVAQALAAECLERYGVAIFVPDFGVAAS